MRRTLWVGLGFDVGFLMLWSCFTFPLLQPFDRTERLTFHGLGGFSPMQCGQGGYATGEIQHAGSPGSWTSSERRVFFNLIPESLQITLYIC